MSKLAPVSAKMNCSFLWNDYFTAAYGTFWTTFMSCDFTGGYLAMNGFINTSTINMVFG